MKKEDPITGAAGLQSESLCPGPEMAERVGEYPNAVFSLEIKGLGP